MSFLDRMKSGLSQVKDKAQQTIEITRIQAQVSAKKKEKAFVFQQLGELVHQAHLEGKLTDQAEAISGFSSSIQQLDAEIQALEIEALKVKGETACSCGAVIPLGSKYCNSCGTEVQPAVIIIEAESTQQLLESPRASCSSCHAPLQPDSIQCTACGTKVE